MLADASPTELRYLLDDRPGIRRKRAGRGFSFVDCDGRRITDRAQRRRLMALAIPPAWQDVWIAPEANAHLLATGRDARGRKQYRYHPDWRALQESNKFDGLASFARALPRIRRRVIIDLARRQLDREKVLALAIRLLERSLIRIGNEHYVQANGSYGLTTLMNRHVRIADGTIALSFRGKGGIRLTPKINDRSLASALRQVQDLPGQRLLSFMDEQDSTQQIDSGMVNDYLRDTAKTDVSAKDFRTWAATTMAADRLKDAKSLKEGLDAVARRLGNTAAICRKSYVHPRVIESFQAGRLARLFEGPATTNPRGLAAIERRILSLLETD